MAGCATTGGSGAKLFGGVGEVGVGGLFRSFVGVVAGVQMVGVRQVGVMGGSLVVMLFSVTGGFLVVVSRVLVVLGGVQMMLVG
jgi:hypothetical protein